MALKKLEMKDGVKLEETDYLALDPSQLNRDIILNAPLSIRHKLISKYKEWLEGHLKEFRLLKRDAYVPHQIEYMREYRKRFPEKNNKWNRESSCRVKIKKAHRDAEIIKDIVNKKLKEEREN